MKKIFFIIVLYLLYVNIGISQKNDILTNKIINDKLLFILNYYSPYYKNMGKDYTFYIIKDNFPVNFTFSNEILNFKEFSIKFINTYNIDNETKKILKKGIQGISFVGLKICDNKLQIGFTSIGIKKRGKNREINMTSDNDFYIYEYSCEKNEWILSKDYRYITDDGELILWDKNDRLYPY